MEAACRSALAQFNQDARWEPGAARTANQLLRDVLQKLQPDNQARALRNAVVQRVYNVLRGMPDFMPDHLRYQGYGRSDSSSSSRDDCLAQLLLFGSFCSGLWHKGSDLDLTIIGRWRNRHGQQLHMATMLPRDLEDMLHRILRALTAAGVAASSNGRPAQVIRARVPLIAFVDRESGIEVDISVSNYGGAFKSIFTRELTAFDERFVALYRLVKLWAETHGLNDPKSGTLNSWALTQLVIFYLQTCRLPVLPPLWQLFHTHSSSRAQRPLEQDPLEQQADGRSSSTSSSSRGRSGSRPRQQLGGFAGAPYELLDVCRSQRQRLQPQYNSSSAEFSKQGPLPLLAGFLVHLREVVRQWCQLQQHRSVKLSTWYGGWLEGGQPWRQDYLMAVEDPFDSGDNTARTLGTWARNDGGCEALLSELDRAVAALEWLVDMKDVDGLMQALFNQMLQQVQAPGFDPINAMMQQRVAQQRQQPWVHGGVVYRGRNLPSPAPIYFAGTCVYV